MTAPEDIHPAAIVSAQARLGRGVKVGPFAIVGPHVTLGDGVILHPHAIVEGHTTLGDGVEVFPNAAVGLRPQDLKYDGAPTELLVGARTVIRECATLQPGTTGGGAKTTVGADCLIMAYSHVAHDCHVGDKVIMANATQLAGHVTVEDGAILGGLTGVHQFVRIGRRAITGAQTRVKQDIPPFVMADGHPAALFGLNIIGLKRAGMSAASIRALKLAYKQIFVRPGVWQDKIREVAAAPGATPEVFELCAFLKNSQRGVTRASFEHGASAEQSNDDDE